MKVACLISLMVPVFTANLKYSCGAGWNGNLEKIMKVDLKIKNAKCKQMCIYRATEYAQKPRLLRLPDESMLEVRLRGEGALDRLVTKLADKLKGKKGKESKGKSFGCAYPKDRVVCKVGHCK